jgi:hypothetical protein
MNAAAHSVPRRSLLQIALSALVAPGMRAQQKFSKTAADYQDVPKNGLTCAACSLFRPPQSCAVVEGDISPNGWCKFFDLPD